MVFTARNRQNPFAARRKREAEAAAAAAAVPAPEASKTPPTPPRAVPVDLNPDSEEYTQTPDISNFATGGIVKPDETDYIMSSPANAERLRDAIADIAARRNLVDATGTELPAEIDEESPNAPLPDADDVEREAPAVIEISADTQAKIDAVMKHAIPPVAEPETPPEDESKRGRGRPRPQETIDRDNAVHALLKAADENGVSKEALALALDEKEQQVYSSLRQLSKEDRAETRYIKGHGYRWFAV